jgi:hypothetical protein
LRKIRRGASARAQKTNPAEGERLLGIDSDAQSVERLERIRHKSFAARFVDGRLGGIGDHNLKSPKP